MNMRSRVDNISLLEKILLGKSAIEGSEQGKKLAEIIAKLDRDFFSTRPSSELASKYVEEQGEYIDALTSYTTFKDQLNPEYVQSMKYLVMSELSDVILSSSTYLTMVGSPDFDKVVKDMKRLCEKTIDICDGDDVFLAQVDSEQLIEFHINKMSEILSAVEIYEEVLYHLTRVDKACPVDTVWVNIVLKLFSVNEIRDPRCKYKIIKEIRRMQFANKNINITK